LLDQVVEMPRIRPAFEAGLMSVCENPPFTDIVPEGRHLRGISALPRKGGSSMKLFFFGLATVNHAALHYEGDLLEHADVVQGVAGHGDDVGIIAGLEYAELVLPVKQTGSV
jgi:hypothetical protein